MTDLPVWVEIDLAALTHNLREIKGIIPAETEIMAVVKANAYGHGAVEVAKAALAGGAARLAVARSSEGLELRRAGIDKPILVLGYTPPELVREVVLHNLEQAVFCAAYAREINRVARREGFNITVHIKTDTGMGRLGVVAGSASAVDEIKEIAGLDRLRTVGIYTHLACADSADKTHTRAQLQKYAGLLEDLRREGFYFPLVHSANSAAMIDHPESCYNLVRAGIAMYGLRPSDEVEAPNLSLRPVMSFRTRVAQVKRVPAGFPVSYGCTYVTEKETVIATLSVGYADGYSRLLSSRGQVLVRGKRAPVVGRVCMDQCMIDAGDIPGVSPGDEVVLFGRQGEAFIPVEEVAGLMGTINYEVVSTLSARVPRVYKNQA
jgi:alanine racemase